jgi:acetyl-CoA C-acetyltransferase
MAKVGPSDIQFAEVHDAFTPFEIIGTEDLGFFPPGEGWRALEEGATQLRGRLPINPSGGLKARGHPVGASGLAQLVEIVWQLRGEAGPERQLESAEIGLAQSIGGPGNNNFVTVLERTDRKRIVKEGWRSSDHTKRTVPREGMPRSLPEGTGILETFTVLYSTPEGFLSPLALGLIKTKGGERTMACNPNYRSPGELRIGDWVSLKKKEGLTVFEKFTLWNRMARWLKRLPRSFR